MVFSRYYLAMNVQNIHNHIERLSNLLKNEIRLAGRPYGLLPVQMEVLHYLSICNRYSDTAIGVSEYLGQTKGTVSQTLKVLERKGYLTRQPDTGDKRITHLRVSAAGQKLLAACIPAPKFTRAIETLDDEVSGQIAELLKLLLLRLQQANGSKSFGVCHSCRHHLVDEQGGYFCDLVKAPLSNSDIHLVCREHATAA